MLELVNLSFKVNDDGNRKEILNDVSLTLEDGKFLVITGPNGSGKTSLAKLVAGIMEPTSGKIYFEGE